MFTPRNSNRLAYEAFLADRKILSANEDSLLEQAEEQSPEPERRKRAYNPKKIDCAFYMSGFANGDHLRSLSKRRHFDPTY